MVGIKMNQVLVLLALTCAASAYHDRVYVTRQNYRRAAEPLDTDKVDETDEKEGLIFIPPYTMWLNDLDSALAELDSHLLRSDARDNNPNDPFIQYVMIVNAVNQLVDASLPDGSSYEMVFYNVVPQVILETIKTPQESADKVRAQADRSNAKTKAIKDLILSKQRDACTGPESYACNLIIDIAVKTSGDDLLTRQAGFMQTLSEEFELFLHDYANEFNEVSKNKGSPAYLINGIDRLRPLVMAAVKARQESKSTPPLLRSTGSKSNKPL